MQLPKHFIIILLGAHISFVTSQIRFESDTTGSGEGRLGGPLDDLNRLSDSFSPNRNLNPNNNSNLVWQPLRATFRPLNRQTVPQPPQPPTPPTSPPTPSPPTPPLPPPEPLALSTSVNDDSDSTSNSNFESFSNRFNNNNNNFPRPQPDQPEADSIAITITTPSPNNILVVSSTLSTISNLNDEDLPTRVPLNRFRPTKAPSIDPQSQPISSLFSANSRSQNSSISPALNNNNLGLQSNNNNNQSTTGYRITNECFECICEASTSCNLNSRCQTSDVRHTRCGMFLISYDQWLATGLSKELVTRDALARDPAADERGFYECVTDRECAERLMSIYAEKNSKDCDKDGRFDCYDIAAIHQGGLDQCNSEGLLESQYWSDFNACFGFGR